MAFKIQANPTFKINVAIPIPGEAAQKVKFTFRHMRKSAYKEWFSQITAENELESMDAVIEGWDAETAYSKDALAEMIDALPGAGAAIFKAYIGELHGAERKN